MGNLQDLLKEVDEILNTSQNDKEDSKTDIENPIDDELLTNLNTYFSYSEFRKGQREIIDAILAGENVFAVFPTGHGKSLCYQLPALMLPGLTVVVSPLISLMKDQVDTLRSRGITSVSLLNSSQTWDEYRHEITRLKQGKIKLLYVSPEKLRSRRFLDLLNTVLISLFVIDEAHCISQWGRDFRPAYLSICDAINTLYPKTIALFTATAPPEIRDDILSVLDISEPKVLVEGIERSNLRLGVLESKKKEGKYALLEDCIDTFSGKGIIYAGRRIETEEITEHLQDKNIRADYYHAGREPDERSYIQDAFFDDSPDGLEVVVATNAFGMGIDKANIRFIIHWTMTGTLEEYCQEFGRAGRDGEDSDCLLFYYHDDRKLHEYFIRESAPDKPALLKLLQELEQYKDVDGYRMMAMDELEWKTGIKDAKIRVCLSYLEKLGFLKRWFNVPSRFSVRLRHDVNADQTVNPELFSQLQKHKATDLLTFSQSINLNPRFVMEQLTEIQSEGHLQYWGQEDLMLIQLLLDSDMFESFSEEQMGFGDYVQRKKRRIDRMVYYAASMECRMKVIREYFGEDVSDDYKCGTCDRCQE
ncbi:RecQ family ATP-dependent DNA helicase [Candidatus Poribacteria bacterium]|nr:MAG: RecQ family ATP-dependent DNA helicase [Candidatus Poribacteria bacterium]